jgi:hypothetical protein
MSKMNKVRAKGLLGAVTNGAESIRLVVYAGMLGFGDAKRVDVLLQPLRSVVNVTEKTRLVAILYASPADFMFSKARSSRFFCDRNTQNAGMAEACLRVIMAELGFSVCELSSLYRLNSETEGLSEHMAKTNSSQLKYTSQC